MGYSRTRIIPALARNFYLNALIGILVYDIRRKESFESIKNYWYEQLKNSGEEKALQLSSPDVPIFLNRK